MAGPLAPDSNVRSRSKNAAEVGAPGDALRAVECFAADLLADDLPDDLLADDFLAADFLAAAFFPDDLPDDLVAADGFAEDPAVDPLDDPLADLRELGFCVVAMPAPYPANLVPEREEAGQGDGQLLQGLWTGGMVRKPGSRAFVGGTNAHLGGM
jgi:hypothetical protein